MIFYRKIDEAILPQNKISLWERLVKYLHFLVKIEQMPHLTQEFNILGAGFTGLLVVKSDRRFRLLIIKDVLLNEYV